MTPGARLQAAIEVLTILEGDRAPADQVLKAWGREHRFAGSAACSSTPETTSRA